MISSLNVDLEKDTVRCLYSEKAEPTLTLFFNAVHMVSLRGRTVQEVCAAVHAMADEILAQTTEMTVGEAEDERRWNEGWDKV